MNDSFNTRSTAVKSMMDKFEAMRKITNDDRLLQVWQHVRSGQCELAFVLDGYVVWETSRTDPLSLPFGLLYPHLDSPQLATLRTFSTRNQYGLCVATAPFDVDDIRRSHGQIREATAKATLAAHLISLASGRGMNCVPAQKVEISVCKDLTSASVATPESIVRFVPILSTIEQTAAVIDDDWLEGKFVRAFEAISCIQDANVRKVVHNAIAWHASANSIFNPSRFVQYWASIELLGTFFYEYLEPSVLGRKPDAVRDSEILKKLLDLNSSNYLDQIRQCNSLLEPSARVKVLALAEFIGEDKDDVRKTLFAKSNGRQQDTDRSLYDIRNDIAHGNVSPLDWEYFDEHREKLRVYQQASSGFIFAVLENLSALTANRMR